MRKRDTIRLSEDGQFKIERARLVKGWNKTDEAWYSLAWTSLATLKRFQEGKRISRDSFINLCNVLGLKEWESLVAWDDRDSTTARFPTTDNTPPPGPLPTLELENAKFRFMMTGIFTEDKQAEIEIVLAHLRHLLLDCTVTFVPDNNSLAVTGTFTEETKQQVEVALIHLQKLMPNCCLTKLPVT